VVISALLPGAEQAENLARQLEIYYLANKLDNVFFGLLGDYPDSKKKKTRRTKKILSAAQNVISDLMKISGEILFVYAKKDV
jgi:cyclic beta-1,2-glucan synthetase